MFDTNYFSKFLLFLASILPALVFFLVWRFFGKELSEPDTPEELSFPPIKRKAWEIAAFFNPPFAKLDKNFFSSLILDFYSRKIIDLKVIEEKSFFGKSKQLYLKINNVPENLDVIERQIISLLKRAKENSNADWIKGEYFSLDKTMKSHSVQSEIKQIYKDIDNDIKDESKKYLSKNAWFIIAIIIIGYILGDFVLSGLTGSTLFSFFYLFFIFFILLIDRYSAIITRFKQDFYKEYLHWQAFKKYLSHSYTISSATNKTIVMWGEYLLYATALGIPKKVLKQGEKIKIVDEQHVAIYAGVYHSSSFVSGGYATATGHGGGFGGAGGGGVGGGGGGGR